MNLLVRRAVLFAVIACSSMPSLAEAPVQTTMATTLATTTTTTTTRARIDASQQLVVVTTGSWTARQGRLHRFARSADGWSAVGAPVAVVVGNKGLAWAADQAPAGATAKHEGDGRAPAGVFGLGRVLGKNHVPKSGLPAAASTADDVCVDDVAHAAYNRVGPVDENAPFKSAEQMVRKDALYDDVVVVDHNGALTGTPAKGAGSCVFLHVWRAADRGTAGCTAMKREALDDVVAWLDATKQPLLVQMPADVYAKSAASLGLPTL